tara:strand:+ start:4425 stop:4655 length:231 start_codon:yes stop_codon:yes gene_type:complete
MLSFTRELLAKSTKVIHADVFGAMRDGLAIIAPTKKKRWGIGASYYSPKVSKALELWERMHGTFYHVLESHGVQPL